MKVDRGSRWLRWPEEASHRRLAFGADYNPEQWPSDVWEEDMWAMRRAGVNIVSLAIFSWARIQPDEEVWCFGWLDEVMDLLHRHGLAVDLATATASPPPWLTTKHPEVLPVDQDGRTVWPGARQHWRPTSPVFREHALRLVRALADRYGKHPALAAWHISNELGCHNVYDFSDDAATAFRDWLRDRYGTLEELNGAWATAFWSQGYSAWEQILPPRLAASYPNPTQQLDFKRFSSDALKDHLRAERDLLFELTPDIPVTTNFLLMDGIKGMDYADWAREVDFVSNDHYVLTGPQAQDELSFSANLIGSLAGGRPWFLMEHSTSAVNWQPVNLAKKPGSMARDSLTHVAHGADAVCFFQWRQSAAGAEKYHSAMIPHAGQDSEIFRSVVDLGATLAALAPIAGTHRKRSAVAIVFDWDSWWASELDSHPTSRLRYRQEALDWYSAFLAAGVRVDVIGSGDSFAHYDLLIAPILHVVPRRLAGRLTDYVTGGGHLVTTYFSGIVDQNDQEIGTTTIYVTHDQAEAMGLGDRIAVLEAGRLRQVGTPGEVYDDPADTFVATFLGSPPMNLVPRGDRLVGFRPEHLLPSEDVLRSGSDAELVTMPLTVERMEYLSGDRHVYGSVTGIGAETRVIARLPATVTTPLAAGETHEFAVPAGRLRFFDAERGVRAEPVPIGR